MADPGLRPVAAESLHVTLAFLGNLEASDLKAAAEIVHETTPEPVAIAFEAEPAGIPRQRRRRRLYALGCESPDAVALQAGIEARLVAARIFKPERAFWPHVTVARVRSEGRRRGRKAVVKTPPGRLPGDLLKPFDVVRLTLYLSKTKSAGAEYAPLAQVELPRGSPNGQQ